MAQVISFPLPPETAMSDAELARHLSGAMGKVLAENGALAANEEFLVSWANSLQKRLEFYQVRHLGWLLACAAGGALAAWTLDGTLAQKLDRALTFLGWVAS